MVGFLHLFDAGRNRVLAAGEPIFFTGDPVQLLVLVREGELHLLRRTASGTAVLLQRARAGEVLSEASVYSGTYHCDAQALVDSRLTLLPVAAFRAGLAADASAMEAWAAHLARSVQQARMRAELRSLRTVAERLEAWLGDGRPLPDKGGWQDLAAELGVSREALYRELARRRAG